MLKFNWVLSTLLLSTVWTSGTLTHWMPTAGAQTNPPKSWEAIFRDFFNQEDNADTKKPGGGTSRGPCILTPRTIGTNTVVWSNRPLFAWRGVPPMTQIEVRLPGSQKALWRKELSTRTFRVTYDGETPLQSGQTYDWVILDQGGMQHSFAFKVLDAQERDRITADLKKLEEELKNNKASDEQIAVRRAEYFAQQQLWSDVLQEVYSVKNPSPELNQKVQSMTGEVCSELLKQNFVQAR